MSLEKRRLFYTGTGNDYLEYCDRPDTVENMTEISLCLGYVIKCSTSVDSFGRLKFSNREVGDKPGAKGYSKEAAGSKSC